MSLLQKTSDVIPAKAGIQSFCMVPGFRRDGVWTPAGVYPIFEAGPV
jgi:hypothetical protein